MHVSDVVCTKGERRVQVVSISYSQSDGCEFKPQYGENLFIQQLITLEYKKVYHSFGWLPIHFHWHGTIINQLGLQNGDRYRQVVISSGLTVHDIQLTGMRNNRSWPWSNLHELRGRAVQLELHRGTVSSDSRGAQLTREIASLAILRKTMKSFSYLDVLSIIKIPDFRVFKKNVRKKLRFFISV